MGKKFIADANVTRNMVTEKNEPIFDLVFKNVPERHVLVKIDILAMAYLDKGMNCSIHNLEEEERLTGERGDKFSDDDAGALAFFKKLKEKIKYARDAALPE